MSETPKPAAWRSVDGDEEARTPALENADSYCPVCSAPLIQEKCKVVCRSAQCVYRLIFNCSEF